MAKPTHKHQHLAQLLQIFAQKHVNALLRHFSESVSAFENSKWETSISNGSKFVEAVIKALARHTGMVLPAAREFKFNKFVQQLGQPSGWNIRRFHPSAYSEKLHLRL